MAALKTPCDFKTNAEAIAAAIQKYPVSPDLLNNVRISHSDPIITRDDFRWFVLFNLLFSLSRHIENTPEDAYLNEIQNRILISANLFLK